MRGIDCTHSRTLKMLPWPWFREGISALKRKSNIFGFLWENRRFLGFSRWRIDGAHSRTVKTPPRPWFREGIDVLKRKLIYLRKESYINVVRVDFYYKQMCSRVFYLLLKDFLVFPWIRVKEAFSRFGSERNRFSV